MGRWFLTGILVLFGRRWSRQWAAGSGQAGQKVRKASGPCMVAVPMGNEKVGIFRDVASCT